MANNSFLTLMLIGKVDAALIWVGATPAFVETIICRSQTL
jgi:hypothetical protein